MQLDMTQINDDCFQYSGWRGVKKLGLIVTIFGLGSIYLWAATSVITALEIASSSEWALMPSEHLLDVSGSYSLDSLNMAINHTKTAR